MIRKCKVCSISFKVSPCVVRAGRGIYCSKSCASTDITKHRAIGIRKLVGHKILTKKGWIVYLGKRKYKYEHRIVLEEKLGRPLTAKEIVVHINNDKTDNRFENLQIITIRDHLKGLAKYREKGEWGEYQCHECGIKFNRRKCSAKDRVNLFCSTDCYHRSQRK